MAKNDAPDVSKFETVPPEMLERVGRKESGVRRVAPEVQKHRDDVRAMAGALVENLDWDEDTNPTAVETPVAKREIEKKRSLIAQIGEVELGQMKVSYQDLQIWHDLQRGVFTDVSKITQLTPHFAQYLIEGWKKPDMILGSLRVLDRATARVLSEWRGNTLCFPSVEYFEPYCLEILSEAKAAKVIFRDGMAKMPGGA